MPVTFKVASHGANRVGPSQPPISDFRQILDQTWTRNQQESNRSVQEVFQSSLSGSDTELDIRVRANGLVNTVVDAYNQHHHLVLRPDDLWMAILSQFNFYINAHAEELRTSFVKHEAKKRLIVSVIGTRFSVDLGSMAVMMTKEIDKAVVDKELKDWILPNFTTSTASDTVICAVLLMSTLKSYFEYEFRCEDCGIPSITLEGTKSDWDSLLSRLDKLVTFGTEPAAFAALLKPVLKRICQTFENTDAVLPQDVDFWSRICNYMAGSGRTDISGWITAFSVWNECGEWIGPAFSTNTTAPDGSKSITFGRELGHRLVLDGIPYAYVDYEQLPPAYCEVDVLLDDNGQKFNCVMVSGLMGSLVEGEEKNSLRPLPAWAIFSISGSGIEQPEDTPYRRTRDGRDPKKSSKCIVL